MDWRQIASPREALALKDTSVWFVVEGKKHIGRVVRNHSVGGLVFFEPDHPDPQNRNAGWVNPQYLQVQA